MNRFRLVALIVCLCAFSQPESHAQELDKELSALATKIAALIKENGKKKVTVLDFTDLQGGSSELGRYIAEELTVNLVMNKKEFAMLDRANLKSILAEHKLTATGLIDPDNAKKLGQFAGVDALILGTITPKSATTTLTAKIITTDTAEIVGAAKVEFKPDETTRELSARPTASNPNQTTARDKPFGELVAKAESLRLLPQSSPGFTIASFSLIISNGSATQTYGVAVHPDFYQNFHLSNADGEEFKANEVSGIATAFDHNDGRFQGSLTDIAPKSSIRITAKSQLVKYGRIPDARPYQLQTVFIWAVMENGKAKDPRKYNLVMEIK